jgi:hypothetical protein
MRRIVLSRSGVGVSAAAPMNINIAPFNIGIGVIVTGTVSYTVQQTYDDVFDPAVTPVWFDHPTLAAKTVSAEGNYAYPVLGVRVSVVSGSGSVRAVLIQAGIT